MEYIQNHRNSHIEVYRSPIKKILNNYTICVDSRIILNTIYQDRHRKVSKQNYQRPFRYCLKWTWNGLYNCSWNFLAIKWGAQEDARDCVQWRRFKLYSHWECLQKLLQLFSHPFLHPNRACFIFLSYRNIWRQKASTSFPLFVCYYSLTIWIDCFYQPKCEFFTTCFLYHHYSVRSSF